MYQLMVVLNLNQNPRETADWDPEDEEDFVNRKK